MSTVAFDSRGSPTTSGDRRRSHASVAHPRQCATKVLATVVIANGRPKLMKFQRENRHFGDDQFCTDGTAYAARKLIEFWHEKRYFGDGQFLYRRNSISGTHHPQGKV